MYRVFGMVGGRVCGVGLFLLAACSPTSLIDVAAPSSIVDPGAIATAGSALQLDALAVTQFDQVFGGYDSCCTASYNGNLVAVSGLFTDELLRAFNSSTPSGIDERTGVNEASGNGSNYIQVYRRFHQPRIQLQQAREALRRYAPNSPNALQGQLYALEAYTILWFGELFCSGIPLSRVPLVGAPSPSAGFTTEALLERANAMFDSAIAVSADSVRILNLAKIGKGRALLGLGRLSDAVAAVQGVPTSFVYNAYYNGAVSNNGIGANPRGVQVVDGEGSNGLAWSTDPRTAITTAPALSGAMKFSVKYSQTAAGILDGTVSVSGNPIRVADGLEARLIEAEADLAAGGTAWFSTLNMLRATCVGTAICAPVPGLAASALGPLSDPITSSARLDMLMRERAMWLYLTGHRQGDLRRLARVYHRDPATLWPTGVYANPGFPPFVAAQVTNGTLYGQDVVLNPMTAESGNPLYGGCYNTDP